MTSVTKRFAATAAAAAVLTAGTVALAGPAAAAPGNATYNCGSGFSTVGMQFDRNSATSVVDTMNLSLTIPTRMQVSAVLDGVGTLSAWLVAGFYPAIALTSQAGYLTLTTAPRVVTISLAWTSTTITTITCNLTSDQGGWPV